MSFKCSLLGHRFDETTVERDRQEDGSEVVTTITELETCSRCGETRVVSENKEVTTMETPDIDAGTDAGVGGEQGRDTGTGAGPGTGTSAGAGVDPAETRAGGTGPEDDAEILDEDGSEADAQTEARNASIPDAETGSGPDPGTAESGDGASEPPEEDAVIIDGDDETAPDDSPGGGAASESQQGVAGGAAGDEEGGTRSDGETVGDTPGNASGGAEWPEEPGSESDREVMDEWPEETRREASEENDVTIEESASPTVTVPEGMFKCSECGFTTEVESSSLRAGDFCPDCHRGTLVQHEDDD